MQFAFSKFMMNFDINQIETLVNIIKEIATIFALIIGGIWSYMLFVKKRQIYPRAKIEHQIQYQLVGEKKLLLSVDVFISNNSDVLLSLESWNLDVKQMLPPRGELLQYADRKDANIKGVQILDWTILAKRNDQWDRGRFEIEPGEQHQFHSDFLIYSIPQSILVESYFRNIKKRSKLIGWNHITIHSIVLQGDKNVAEIRTRTEN